MTNDDFNINDDIDENVIKASIHCVFRPTAEQVGKIKDFICRKYEADRVDLDIISDSYSGDGFDLFVGEDHYDWSTAGRVRQLRERLKKLPKENEVGKMISLLKGDIGDFKLDSGYEQIGEVIYVADGIVMITGLHDVGYGEVVIFEQGIKGMVQDIRSDGTTGVILFGESCEIAAGSRVYRTRRTAGIPISNRVLGRMINPLGQPIDGGDKIGAKEYFRIERPAPGIVDRKPVSKPMETGILSVDSMFPIGRGQRELIIGDRQTGKTSIAIDTILNQKGKDVICVYVAIGQKATAVAKVVNILKKAGAMEYTVVVSSPASDSASLQYIAPYAGCAVAEYFMYSGKDTLIIYDDLSKHAVAYRTISLLLERAPGREAYPGDVFYLHSRLLERSAQLSDRLGGGSMTALPIVETQAGDVSAYIPTNIISITDGQLFLDSEMFYSGQRPAVNVGLSVSRVGGAAQLDLMKKSVGTIRLDLAQYREMKVFSQFSSDLDEQTLIPLRYGAGLMQILKQANQEPLSFREQVILLTVAQARMFLDVPEKDIPRVKKELLKWMDESRGSLCATIDHTDFYSKKLSEHILKAAEKYFKRVYNRKHDA